VATESANQVDAVVSRTTTNVHPHAVVMATAPLIPTTVNDLKMRNAL
jgi:hypothetical protein